MRIRRIHPVTSAFWNKVEDLAELEGIVTTVNLCVGC
jgi:hypothetical protein